MLYFERMENRLFRVFHANIFGNIVALLIELKAQIL